MSDVQIKIVVSEQQKELIEKWQKYLRFKSQRETTEFLLTLGTMALEMSGGEPITADGFASMLYTIGSRFFVAEYSNNTRKTVEEFQRWREQQEITAQTSSNVRQLVQR